MQESGVMRMWEVARFSKLLPYSLIKTCMCLCVCIVHGHPQLHRVITLPATQSNSASSSSTLSSSSSSVPDWVQRSVKFGSDKKPPSSSHTSRLSVTGVGDSLCHVPLSPQSSDASSGSAGPDVDDTSSTPGMQGMNYGICFQYLSLRI